MEKLKCICDNFRSCANHSTRVPPSKKIKSPVSESKEKCNNGACRACHDGINEDNPTGQRGKCPSIIESDKICNGGSNTKEFKGIAGNGGSRKAYGSLGGGGDTKTGYGASKGGNSLTESSANGGYEVKLGKMKNLKIVVKGNGGSDKGFGGGENGVCGFGLNEKYASGVDGSKIKSEECKNCGINLKNINQYEICKDCKHKLMCNHPQTEEVEDWVERFDKVFDKQLHTTYKEMKEFIKCELSSNTERVKREILEKIEDGNEFLVCNDKVNKLYGFECGLFIFKGEIKDIINNIK